MIEPNFRIKRNDLLPLARFTLRDSSGVALNLTGLAVVFNMRLPGAETNKVNRGTVAIVNPTGGIVEYTWVTGDTDTAGLYAAEFEVTASAKAFTFPDEGFIWILVDKDLG